MQKRQLQLFASACATLVLAACVASSSVTQLSPLTVTGETKPLGNSMITTFARVNASGAVTAIGVTFGAGALTGLPTTATETTLALPPAVSTAPFTFFAVNWNPMGHPPPGIYDVPHFDFHFYTISDAARMAIQSGPATAPPPAAAVPPGYVGDAVTIQKMGTHFIDRTAPEWSGQAFTSALVYGYYSGTMAFIEPMVALSFLTTTQGYDAAIKQPTIYQLPGLFPTHYSVSFDSASNVYTLTLDGLANH